MLKLAFTLASPAESWALTSACGLQLLSVQKTQLTSPVNWKATPAGESGKDSHRLRSRTKRAQSENFKAQAQTSKQSETPNTESWHWGEQPL